MRRRLYDTAVALIGERGYEAATLRDVARQAGVSTALLYRYFPSKRAVVLALYDDLSGDFAQRAVLSRGRWRDRFIAALRLSLDVLGPHRVPLRALTPLMVGDADEGVFAERSRASRRAVQRIFEVAVTGATDAPGGRTAAALGRLLYLVHLAVLLWWLLDRTPRQRATTALVGLFERMLPAASLTLRLPSVRRFVEDADALASQALTGDPAAA